MTVRTTVYGFYWMITVINYFVVTVSEVEKLFAPEANGYPLWDGEQCNRLVAIPQVLYDFIRY